MKEDNLLIVRLSAILITLCLCSCNPVKKVLADIDKVKQVRTATDALFPCVNDTVTVSKADTVTSYDTTYLSEVVVGTVFRDTTKVYITKTLRIRDTVKISIRDGREEKRLQQDLDKAVADQIKYLNQSNEDKEDKREAEKASVVKNWIIGFLGVIIALLVYLLFKKK